MRQRADVVLVQPILATPRAAELATKHRLAAVSEFTAFAEAGGIIAYGANRRYGYHRAAAYVDRILKGAQPRDLPVEQPTRFELVINLKAAKALGLTVPSSVLARADKVIQ